MQRAAIYCRLSEEDKNKKNALQDSESIQNQKSMLAAYAMQHGWEIYGIYSDEDYSGVDLNRPEFNRLLKDAEEKKFNIVLCKTQSRFTRDMEVVERYIHNKFIEWGIRFVASVDNADTDNKGNKKARQINGLVNEWFLEDLSENIKSVLTSKRSNGQYIGTFFPYGYLKDPANKNRLVIDPVASRTVKKIFEMYTSGFGINKVVQVLNEQHLPNPTAYKKQMGYAFCSAKSTKEHGHLWSTSTVREILKNRVYLGHMVQGKYRHVSYKNKKLVRIPKEQWITVENTHEPVINQELFDKAAKRLCQNVHPQKQNGCISIFAGKVKCLHCGSAMHKTYSKNMCYLYCRAKEQSPKACRGSGIRFSLLEQAVLQSVQAMAQKYETSAFLQGIIKESVRADNETAGMVKKRGAIEREIDDLSNMLFSLYADKARGIISEAQFLKLTDGLNKKEEALKVQLAAFEASIEDKHHKYSENPQLCELLDKYNPVRELNREIVDAFISHIDIGYDESTRKKAVHIHWNI